MYIQNDKQLFVKFIQSGKTNEKFKAISASHKDWKRPWMDFLGSKECLELWNERIGKEKAAGR